MNEWLSEIRARRATTQRDFDVSPFLADLLIVRNEAPKASVTYAILLGYLRRAGDKGAYLADLCRTITGNPDDTGVNTAAHRLRDMGLVEFGERRRPGGYHLKLAE